MLSRFGLAATVCASVLFSAGTASPKTLLVEVSDVQLVGAQVQYDGFDEYEGEIFFSNVVQTQNTGGTVDLPQETIDELAAGNPFFAPEQTGFAIFESETGLAGPLMVKECGGFLKLFCGDSFGIFDVNAAATQITFNVNHFISSFAVWGSVGEGGGFVSYGNDFIVDAEGGEAGGIAIGNFYYFTQGGGSTSILYNVGAGSISAIPLPAPALLLLFALLPFRLLKRRA